MFRTFTHSAAARRFALFLVFLAVTGTIALLRIPQDMHLTPEAVRDAVRSWGVAAPAVFTAAFVLRPFIFFPSTLLFLAGGLAFGVKWGTIYAALGSTLGAVVGFGLARALGRDFVHAQLGAHLDTIQRDRWGAGLVFLLNLIPLVPMTIINYGAGLSGMEVLPFTVAAAAGLTPRAFAYSLFGHSLLDIRSRTFVLAVAILAALIVVPLYVRRYLMDRADGGVA
jgi:uncharacterized membrane protein YdjX (TVP38/TMEM64 family)